jgi:hypothetical protein
MARTGLSPRSWSRRPARAQGCLRGRSTAHPHRRSPAKASDRKGNPELGSRMDESFSPMIFIYGLAFILGVGKACTLLIWRTLPRPRPGLRQEVKGGLASPESAKVAREDDRSSTWRPGQSPTDIPGRTVSAMTCAVRSPWGYDPGGGLPTCACRYRTPWDGS